MESSQGISVPASALTATDREPALWIVDPATIDRLAAQGGRAALRSGDGGDLAGIDGGEIVVTAGVQALHPGQKVRLLGAPS